MNMEEEEYNEFMEFQKWKKLRSKMKHSPRSSNMYADNSSLYSEMTYPQKMFNQNSLSTKLPTNESKSVHGLNKRQNHQGEESEDSDSRYKTNYNISKQENTKEYFAYSNGYQNA
jgi:hypothetical protein